MYGFAKSDRDSIDGDEEIAFKKAAQHVLRLSEEQLAALIDKGQLTEVHHHDQEIP